MKLFKSALIVVLVGTAKNVSIILMLYYMRVQLIYFEMVNSIFFVDLTEIPRFELARS